MKILILIFYLDKKSQENILIYNISHKTLLGAKPLHIRFDEVDVFIRVYDGTKCLVLLGLEKEDAIYNRIRCLLVLHMLFS